MAKFEDIKPHLYFDFKIAMGDALKKANKLGITDYDTLKKINDESFEQAYSNTFGCKRVTMPEE